MIHTDLKPENVLLEWPVVFCADRRTHTTAAIDTESVLMTPLLR